MDELRRKVDDAFDEMIHPSFRVAVLIALSFNGNHHCRECAERMLALQSVRWDTAPFTKDQIAAYFKDRN
jgi:hypothetical protein